MKITNQQMIIRLNTVLENHNQNTRVVSYTGNCIVLSTGLILMDNSKHKFYKRIMNTKTDLWVNQIDNLLSGIITEEEIRSKLASIGGTSVQAKHGDKIKKNLNTGRSWNTGTKGQNTGKGKPRSPEIKQKISKKNSGEGNGMYGYRYTPLEKTLKSQTMRNLILEGKFTPNSNNKNTHWESMYNGKKYRSSWEALYQYFNPQAEYEKFRIEYILSGIRKIYIVDFIDYASRYVIEVKPIKLCVGEIFKAKMKALNEWAKQNNYTVLLITEDWLIENQILIEYSRFDIKTEKKIRAFYEAAEKNRN